MISAIWSLKAKCSGCCFSKASLSFWRVFRAKEYRSQSSCGLGSWLGFFLSSFPRIRRNIISWSSRSIIENCSKPKAFGTRRSRYIQKVWKVEARSPFACSPKASSTRATISLAERRVKVKIWIWLAGIPWSIRYAARATMVFVLPQPAPASTRLCCDSVVAACFCCGFNSSIRLAKLIITHQFVDATSLTNLWLQYEATAMIIHFYLKYTFKSRTKTLCSKRLLPQKFKIKLTQYALKAKVEWCPHSCFANAVLHFSMLLLNRSWVHWSKQFD